MKTQHMDDHKTWADLLRVTAIFGVIVIHACGFFFYQFRAIPDVEWLWVNFVDSLVRCAVPLFVMLSGALLLEKSKGVAQLQDIFSRILKVGVPLVVWSVAYLFYVASYSGERIRFASLVEVPAMYHLWFVYMIVGIYTLLPVLQLIFIGFLERLDLKIYFFILWLLLTVAPRYETMPLLALVQQSALFGYGGYFLLGAWLVRLPADARLTKLALVVYLAAVGATFWLTWRDTFKAGQVVESAYEYFSLNVVIASVAAFVLFSRLVLGRRVAGILRRVSDLSFLVFLMHVVILERVNSALVSLGLGIPLAIHVLGVAVLTFFISLALAYLLRLLPLSRRLVG